MKFIELSPKWKERLTPRNVFFGIMAFTVLPIVGLLIYAAIILSEGLPSLEELENPRQEMATQVLSADGEIIDQFYVKQRQYMPFDSIPKEFLNGLIATEDREFYNHWGIHTMRLVKAVIKNILAFRTREGASTLTQQLARNLYINHKKVLSRKVKEAFTALEIERTHTKREIIELYTNEMYFGRSAYGLQVASQVYFNKMPNQLRLDECAFLAGIVQRPFRYEKNYEAAITRRNVVLAAMRDMDYITNDQYTIARNTQTRLASMQETVQAAGGIAPHFVEWIRQKLQEDQTIIRGRDLYRDGLIIYTTVNARMQEYANQAVQEHLSGFQKDFSKLWRWEGKTAQGILQSVIEKSIKEHPDYINANGEAERKKVAQRLRLAGTFIDSLKQDETKIQSGFVVIDHSTGEIKAMVGSSVFNKLSRYSLNHVTQIRRQPGSAFKPFVYSCALANGLTSQSEIESSTLSYQLPGGRTWDIVGTKEGGMISLAQALKFSVNSVAARLITEHVRPGEVIKLAKKSGIKTELEGVYSIALGSEEVTPLELTASYSIFANQGVYTEPFGITRIEDRFGNVLYDKSRIPAIMNEAISPRIAREMIGMMRNVVNSGTAARIRRWFPYEAAGKSGTTNDFADSWFVGFTPQLSAGVWIGFDDHRVKFTGWYGQGGTAAAPIWARFMAKVYKDPILRYRSSQRFNVDIEFTPDEGDIPDDNINNPPMENAPPPPNKKTNDSTGAGGG